MCFIEEYLSTTEKLKENPETTLEKRYVCMERTRAVVSGPEWGKQQDAVIAES